jgi:ferritin-like protein
MGGEYHETGLSEEAKDLHRAVASLIEELEAIDWYHQRIDISKDENLKAILAHNRDEEMEHAVMILEWLRRKLPHLDAHLRKYLFSAGPIHKIHESQERAAAKVDDRPGDLGIARIEE